MAMKQGKSTQARRPDSSPIERKKAAAALIRGEREKVTLESFEKRIRALEDLVFENTGLLD